MSDDCTESAHVPRSTGPTAGQAISQADTRLSVNVLKLRFELTLELLGFRQVLPLLWHDPEPKLNTDPNPDPS